MKKTSTMDLLTFHIDNDKDAKLLINIAAMLGIRKYKLSKTKAKTSADLLNIIEKGAEVSSFGNPVGWQRQTRKDRNIDSLK